MVVSIFTPVDAGINVALIYSDRMLLLSVGHMWMIFTPVIPGVGSALNWATKMLLPSGEHGAFGHCYCNIGDLV